jgi:hypothetical protein
MNWSEIITKLLEELNKDSSVDIYWKLTQAYRNNTQLLESEDIADTGLKIYPDNPVLLSEWAWNAQVKKDYKEASIRLEKLINTLNPNVSEKIYTRLLNTYKNLNELESLKNLLQIALKKYPNSDKIKHFLKIEENDDFPKDCKIIILTTFPKHASNNVGDQLITYSFLKLLKSRIPDLKYHIEFRANNLNKYRNKNITHILAPGFSIANDVYPNIYGLYSDLNNLPTFSPIGCSFQHIIPSHEVFENNTYSKEDKSFFNSLLEKMDSPYLCRDQLIVEMLQNNGIPSIYSGDLAIYDEDYLNTQFKPPKEINSIVFTIQHHEKYTTQSYILLSLIKNKFSNTKLYISYHSKINTRSKKIAEFAISLGFEEIFMFGDVKNLDFYNNIDLHIGYRLHGHISFLRRRKPSVLLVEDARSFGFANTKGTSIGCFNALNSDQTINNLGPIEAIKFIEEQIEGKFEIYNNLFRFIDKTFKKTLLPYIDKLTIELKK